MKFMKILLIVVFAGLMFCSCAHLGNLPSKCDNIQEGESVLCDFAKDKEYRIEDVGNAFIMVNAIAIGEGLYTRQEAIVVCEALKRLIDDNASITYILFKDGLLDRVNRYPGLLEVAMSYMPMFDLNVPISEYDRALLVNWLNARISSLGG